MFVFRLLIAGLTLFVAQTALAQGVVEEVRFESRSESLDFLVTASTPIDGSLAELIPARRGEVLIIRLGGITAKRQWIKTRDPLIKRTLLHPSTQRPPGAILRIRFKKRVISRDLVTQVDAVFVGDDQRTVRISVPRPGGPIEVEQPAAKPDPPAEAPVDPPSDPPPVDPPSDPPPADPPSDPPPADPPSDPPPADPPSDPPPADPDPTPAAPPASMPADSPPADSPPAPSESTTPGPTMPAPPAETPQIINPVVLPSGPTTADVKSGIDDVIGRLRLGIDQRPGIARVAVVPLVAMDGPTADRRYDGAATALIDARLMNHGGLVHVETDQVAHELARLYRAENGRYALDEARAVARMLGADTLLTGSVGNTADGVLVEGRAIDVASGRDLAATSQVISPSAMAALTDAMIDERTAAGAVWRSAVFPGWGQVHQGHTGRGAGYATGFTVTLGAGIVSAVLGSIAEEDYNSADPETVSRRADADDHYSRAAALLVGAGAVWLASLVDAIVTGEDQLHWDTDADAPAGR